MPQPLAGEDAFALASAWVSHGPFEMAQEMSRNHGIVLKATGLGLRRPQLQKGWVHFHILHPSKVIPPSKYHRNTCDVMAILVVPVSHGFSHRFQTKHHISAVFLAPECAQSSQQIGGERTIRSLRVPAHSCRPWAGNR